MENTYFNIIIASLVGYEYLVAEIYCNDKFVALISQERGRGDYDLEVPGCDVLETEVIRRTNMLNFIKAINRAATMLSNC